jgi:hypothetical protein
MKKIAIVAFSLVALYIAGCKKEDNVSRVVSESYPTLSIPGGIYYSINTGGSLPTINGSSYDSVLKESYPLKIEGAEDIDNQTPGLYIVQATATNKNGYKSFQNVYVAVTDIPAAYDLSGQYKRAATGGIANVDEVANGLYVTDNVGGVVAATNADLIFPVLFVHIRDTVIDLPAQVTPVGTIEAVEEKLFYTPDTTFQYRLSKGGTAFGTTATRIFVKQ